MGLFDKKTCAICGGKVKGLFPLHLGDDYVCDDCSIFIHAHDDVLQKMTLDDFLKYKEFHQENQKLKDIFEMTKVCEYGLVFNKLYLDSNHHLFCLNSDLSTTIFEAKYVDRFTIMEDSFPLYEGTAEGLNYYPSEVPSYARSLTPLVIQMHQEYERFEDEVGYIQPGLREPFEKFYITIYLKDHPYWPSIELKYDGPTFTAPTPDISRYLREYTEKAHEMNELAQILMDFVVEGAKARGEEAPAAATAVPAEAPAAAAAEEPAEPAPAADPVAEPAPAAESVAEPAPVAQAAPASPLGESDTIIEIKRYKELLDAGIITEEEFTAKKRQLMGI